MSSMVFAQVPVTAPSNKVSLVQKVKTTISDIQTKVTTSTVVTKTASAIGSVKNSISSYMQKAQEKIAAVKEKADKYKEKAQKYKDKIEKAKQKAQKYKDKIDKAKAMVQDAKDAVNTVKDKVNEVKDKVNEVKSTINDVKGKIEEAKNTVNDIKDAAQGAVELAKSKIDDVKDKAGISSGTSGGGSVNYNSNNTSGGASGTQSSTGYSGGSTYGSSTAGSSNNIDISPRRKPIIMSNSAQNQTEETSSTGNDNPSVENSTNMATPANTSSSGQGSVSSQNTTPANASSSGQGSVSSPSQGNQNTKSSGSITNKPSENNTAKVSSEQTSVRKSSDEALKTASTGSPERKTSQPAKESESNQSSERTVSSSASNSEGETNVSNHSENVINNNVINNKAKVTTNTKATANTSATAKQTPSSSRKAFSTTNEKAKTSGTGASKTTEVKSVKGTATKILPEENNYNKTDKITNNTIPSNTHVVEEIDSRTPDNTRQTYYAVNENNELIGEIDEKGTVKDSKNNIIGQVMKDEKVVDPEGNVIGKMVQAIEIFDEQGNIVDRRSIDGTEIKVKAEEEKETTTDQPSRAAFTTSYGYGSLHNSMKLAFADVVTGETEDGVPIINDDMGDNQSLAEACKLDYKTAGEEGRLTGCLAGLNEIAIASNTEDEEIAKKMKEYGVENSEEASTLLWDDYASDLAVRFIEALNIYNESLGFKNKVVELTSKQIKENTNAIRMVKQMQQLLNERLNDLRKLQARQLATKMKEVYIEHSLTSGNDGE